MPFPFLTDIVIILALSSLVLLICYRLHVPNVIGFLLTGMLAGPYGGGLITETHDVEILAEIGVVLLLFTIGLEFSIQHLINIKKAALLGGALQVFLTCGAGWIIASQFEKPTGQAVFWGMLIALSSTAIVLKLLQERAEVESIYGRTVLAILIFQDIIIVPMMLITPLLAGSTTDIGVELLLLIVKGCGIILFVVVSAKVIVPNLLYQIARTRSRELFSLAIVVICLAVALLTSSLGLSLALGAFLAGLIISESEYSHQALGHVLPFRDIFTSFFFISIGMLMDVSVLIQQPGIVLLITSGVLLLKAIIAGIAALCLRLSLRTAIMTGLALCQVGEFSFILSRTGITYGLLTDENYQLFLNVSIVTMAMTPFILALAPRIAGLIERLPLPLFKNDRFSPVPVDPFPQEYLDGHLIIIGYGVNGRNVARSARISMIPYVIVEMNPETVRVEKANGEPILYGDATQEAVLNAAGIRQAHIVVAAVPEAVVTRSIVASVRQLNASVHIIARTRTMPEVSPLYELGANEVIPEEFETSVEIFTRVLVKYQIPRDDIEAFIAEVRSDGYGMYRQLAQPWKSLFDLKLQIPDMETATYRVNPHSSLAGQTLAESDLRRTYGVTVLSIEHEGKIQTNPDAHVILAPHDIVVVIGRSKHLITVASLFSSD